MSSVSEERKGERPSSTSSNAADGDNTSNSHSPTSKLPKIEILLYATGDAPIIKNKKWTLEPNKQIAYISNFVKKLIKCDAKDSLFLYVNQSFAPSPDTDVGSLYECFGSDGKLVLHYCKTQAWG